MTYDLFYPDDLYEENYNQKSRRFCFIAAIYAETDNNSAGLVNDSFWSFTPNQLKHHKVDCHRAFNNDNYLNWFENKLLANLHKPSLIVIDNASYHKVKPKGTPDPSRMRKSEVINELRKLNIPHDESVTAIEAKVLLRDWIGNNVEPAVVLMARDRGHEVLFTPPHFSDLQPIELVWASIKGNVASSYDKYSTFQDVHNRLLSQFDHLRSEQGASDMRKIVDHVDDMINKFIQEIDDSDGDEVDLEIESNNGSDTVSDNSTITDSDCE